jgi:phosphotransferase system HPr (HPr) family protein
MEEGTLVHSIPFPAILSTTEVMRRIGPGIQIKVLNTHGLHARPAAAIVRALYSFSADVAITYRRKTANARSVLGLLMLGVPCGSSIKVKAWGSDADAALKALETLFLARFSEGAANGDL